MSVKKASEWKKNPIIISTMQFKSRNLTLIHGLVTYSHKTRLTQNPGSLFYIMCFINCTAMIDPTVSWWSHEVPINEKSLRFLCSLSTVNKDWSTVRIWDHHSRDSKLKSRITALKLALVKSMWWRGKLWALVEGRCLCSISVLILVRQAGTRVRPGGSGPGLWHVDVAKPHSPHLYNGWVSLPYNVAKRVSIYYVLGGCYIVGP